MATGDRRERVEGTAEGLPTGAPWPGARRAVENGRGGDFSFIQVNDVHYRDDRDGYWFEEVLRRMMAHPEGIDFCLVCGDVADQGTAEQLGAMRELLGTLGMPYYPVIGNHDYTEGDASRTPYDAAFPGRINYVFEHRDWQFLGLDTSEGTRFEQTAVQPHTLHFLAETLPKLDRARPTVVFTHFPMGPRTPMRPVNMDGVLELLKPYNLQACFSGHFHGWTERHLGSTTLTTGRCCSFSKHNHDGSREKGYYLCRAKEGKLARTFVPVD